MQHVYKLAEWPKQIRTFAILANSFKICQLATLWIEEQLWPICEISAKLGNSCNDVEDTYNLKCELILASF